MDLTLTDSVFTPSINPCNLCPRRCGALRSEGHTGVCGANDQVYIARAALHFWEEPPLSGERGSGALFFSHCPLSCVYCQNRTISAGGAGVPVSIDRLSEICLELQEQGALNINCVTPTHYSIALSEAIGIARKRGLTIPVVWNTSGYECADIIRWLKGTVDVYLDDFKYLSKERAGQYSHVEDYPEIAIEALDAMLETVGTPRFDDVDGNQRLIRGVVVRHLMLPEGIDESMSIIETLYNRYGNDVLYSIMNQYTPVMSAHERENFPELAISVPEEDYERLLDFADSLGMEEYYWQEGPAALESFIPTWDGTGVV
ncbi:MAG: radical SAM protein [Eggerthellaceae bacterium]|nr:radical SAM protein [Eggerthellaceae bacterium]